jgi:hypothetical protein
MTVAAAIRAVLRIAAAGLCAVSIEGAIPASAATMEYWDGPVVAQVKVVPVFWSSFVNAQVKSDMQQFFADAVNSPWYDALMQYSTNVNGGTDQTIVRGTAETGVVLAPSRCATGANCMMTDAELQTELLTQITASNLPTPDNNTVYIVFIPPNVTVAGPNGIGNSGQQFCNYNWTTQTSGGQAFPYGLVIDTFTGNGATGCGANATGLENETQTAAITLANIVTDPQIGFVGNTIAAPAGWYGTMIVNPKYPEGAGQVGDACDYANTGGTGPTITVSGRTWTVASIFNLSTNGCLSSFVDQMPSVSSISPTHGPAAAGTSVTIFGSNFTGTTAVNFGAATASSFAFLGDNELTAIAPAGGPAGGGPVSVTVTNGAGTSAASEYIYSVTHDFNGDGMSDVLWRDTSGNVAIWEMNGTSILNQATSFVSQVPLVWSIVGSGDYNGDGKSDIVWYNGGNVAIWEMNGTTILNQATSFITNVPTVWSIQDPQGN